MYIFVYIYIYVYTIHLLQEGRLLQKTKDLYITVVVMASSNNIKTRSAKASSIFRFIDDLCTFNNGEFENNYNDIYPNELELKKKN